MINFNASLAMFDDLLSVFEEKGFHWAIWTYKDLGQMGLVSSKEETPWKQFCSSPDVRVWQEEYRAAHSRFIDDLKQRLPALTTLDMRDLNTQIPHHWHAVTLPHVVELLKGKTPSALADMARSFAFENCDVHSDKLEVLRRHLQ
jgi:hypothetical protein